MKRITVILFFVLACLFLPNEACAQSGTLAIPDCVLQFSFLQSGGSTQNSQTYINYPASGGSGGGECTTWVVTYATLNVSTSISVLLQSAPAMTNQITPGTWVTYTGTTVTGSNPTTTTTPGGQFFGTNDAVSTPFLRVQVSSFVDAGGRVWGTLLGWKQGPSGAGGGGGSGCPGTTGTPCVVIGPTASGSAPTTAPVLNAGTDGTDVRTLKTDTSGDVKVAQIPHTSSAVNVSSSGLTQILAASGSNTTTIYHFSILLASPVNFQLEYGTGSNCGSGTTALTGTYQNAAGIALDIPITVPASQNLCANLGSGVNGGGLLLYSQP